MGGGLGTGTRQVKKASGADGQRRMGMSCVWASSVSGACVRALTTQGKLSPSALSRSPSAFNKSAHLPRPASDAAVQSPGASPCAFL